MRKNEIARLEKKKVVTFWTIMAILTVIFVSIIITMIVRNTEYKSYEQLSRRGMTLKGTEMFGLTTGDYYIYMYCSDDSNNTINQNKQKDLEPYIVNYFNFVRQNRHKGNVCEIRMLDVAEKNNKGCLSNQTTPNATSWNTFIIDESTLPALVYMTVSEAGTNTYSYSYDIYTTSSDIKTQLSNSISTVVGVNYVAPIKKKFEL